MNEPREGRYADLHAAIARSRILHGNREQAGSAACYRLR